MVWLFGHPGIPVAWRLFKAGNGLIEWYFIHLQYCLVKEKGKFKKICVLFKKVIEKLKKILCSLN